MGLRVVGAGLPRTGTHSLKIALERVLGGRCHHMTEILGHPFDLGAEWRTALEDDPPDWERLLARFVATVDWPASMFWRPLSEAYPDALVLLSTRGSAREWWESVEATILPVARRALAPDWNRPRDLVIFLEHFTGTDRWDQPDTLMEAYERHNAAVRKAVSAPRLLEWRPGDGWDPLCTALGIPVPDEPFPWRNRREDWG